MSAMAVVKADSNVKLILDNSSENSDSAASPSTLSSSGAISDNDMDFDNKVSDNESDSEKVSFLLG